MATLAAIRTTGEQSYKDHQRTEEGRNNDGGLDYKEKMGDERKGSAQPLEAMRGRRRTGGEARGRKQNKGQQGPKTSKVKVLRHKTKPGCQNQRTPEHQRRKATYPNRPRIQAQYATTNAHNATVSFQVKENGNIPARLHGSLLKKMAANQRLKGKATQLNEISQGDAEI
ncbi:hypothetical protein MMC16_006241 [Acarospora aff. strigata]|nr:hypothetical protein [Acarospora aff. strigata]